MQKLPDDEELNEIIEMIEIDEIPDDPKAKKLFDAKIYYLNNKEKYKQYYENRKAKKAQIEKVSIVCPICNCTYFENHLARHVRTKNHKLALKANEKEYLDEIEMMLKNNLRTMADMNYSDLNTQLFECV